MLKDITLGQYFPGNTPVHRLDPRTKLLALILYIVTIFTTGKLLPGLICVAALGAAVAVARIPLKMMLKGGERPC